MDNDDTNQYNKYLNIYKSLCDKYKTSPYPQIKDFCFVELQRIKSMWINDFHFDVKDIAMYEPNDLTI